MHKILITIQGRTLILYYQIKRGLARNGSAATNYIQVLPSAELSRFNLRGLTPEMFCVNIADMVNIRGLYAGQVENERQIPVAKWAINHDEFLQIKHAPAEQLTHRQIVTLLAAVPGYTGETDDQYVEFEEAVVPHQAGAQQTFSGYRLTLMTEEIDNAVSTRAYYYLDTRTPQGWQDTPPPQEDIEAVRSALQHKIHSIRQAGVQLAAVVDETDYLLPHNTSSP